MPDEKSRPSRVALAMQAIRARIDSGALTPGERLPSIRSFAATMKLSPSTVVEAYDRLTAEGLARARRGSGFYVAGRPAPFKPAAIGGAGDRAIDPFWVSRQSLDADAGMSTPGCGWLPDAYMPVEELRRAARALARADARTLLDYGPTRGDGALRRLLSARLADEGLEVAPERILLTGSGTQAIDLICRFMLKPGDAVLVDDPCYFNFRALLAAHRVKVVGVPYTRNGPDVAAFEAALSQESPRLYVTNSALHNPTGATMSAQVAHRVLTSARAHDVVIVEDDIFADFEPEPSVRLAALDGLSRVIRIGSFSKTLSASARCGYVAARADWIEGLIDLQVATAFGGASPVATALITTTLSGGGYRKHLETVRRRLAQARRDVARRLAPLGLTPWIEPRGGFYLWMKLPEGGDGASIARAALKEGVVLAPGDVFSVSSSARAFMRFNVAQSNDPRLCDVLACAMRAPEGRQGG